MKLSVPAFALLVGLSFGALVSSCGPAKKVCTPTTCSGCCDGNTGACVSVTSNQSCGTRGETCKACSLGQVCSFGSCMGGNNTGAGSAGGFVTAGGSAGGAAGGDAGGMAGGGLSGGSAGGFGGGFGGGVGGGAVAGGFAGGFAGGGAVAGGVAGGAAGGVPPSCSSANCSQGCCQGATCILPPVSTSNSSCGFAGFACANCAALGQVCSQISFLCEPGAGGGAAGGSAGGAAGGMAVGDNCTAPAVLVLSGGTGSTSGSLTGLANDSTECSGVGPDAVYSVTVANGGVLQASVTATGFTPRINIRSTCMGSSLACDANPVSGIAQTSASVSAGTYFVFIDSSSSGASGSYSLFVTTSGAGGGAAGGGGAGGGTAGGASGTYTKTVITASCDSVTTGTLESAALGDDAATSQAPLPIAFSFFGVPRTTYTVSSNGLMQVWSGAGTGSVATSGTVIPIGGIAPFWDDLDFNTSTSLRSLVLGSGSTRRFVVEWSDWGFYSSGTGSTADRLRFQAKLFESGVIEFHYCSLVGTALGIDGSSATIGVGDSSLNQVIHGMTVSTGTGLRFTP